MPETAPSITPEILAHRHDAATAMDAKWERYRAFTGSLEEGKSDWLPQGAVEDPRDYAVRVKLTEHLGWSEPCVTRMSGTLTKAPAAYTFPAESAISKADQDKIQSFVKNSDGTRRSLASWWTDVEPEVLTMGLGGAEVVIDEPGGAPYLTSWKAEEIYDWDIDARGDLRWVKLRRETTERATFADEPQKVTKYRILTRSEGFDYTVTPAPEGSKESDSIVGVKWTHNLGIVPFQPIYARRKSAMTGVSYIEVISRGDRRLLRLESDQSMASYNHASPLLGLWSKKKPAEVGVGASSVIHLQAGGAGAEREDAKYITVDVAGMGFREQVIERTSRQTLNAAGIDPSAVVSQGATGRSGVSIAWSFSTAEVPTLNALSEEMDAADKGILEIVTRYIVRGRELAPPNESVFDDHVARAKKWDMMKAQEKVDLYSEAETLIPSDTAKKEMGKDLARTTMPDAAPETLAKIDKEIDAHSFAPPDIGPGANDPAMPMDNPADMPPQMLRGKAAA